MIGSNQQQDCTELEARITISDLHTPTTTHKQRDWLEGIRVVWSPLLAERGSVATSGTVQRRQKYIRIAILRQKFNSCSSSGHSTASLQGHGCSTAPPRRPLHGLVKILICSYGSEPAKPAN